MTDLLDLPALREQFPAFNRRVGGQPALHLDAPGGMQAPRAVSEAMAEYLLTVNANAGGVFATSRETGALIAAAREAAGAFLGNEADGIVFGPNMTTLAFSFSRALARGWRAGDEVVVTTLDHDANVSPWLLAAEDRGAGVRTLRCADDGTIGVDALRAALTPRTRVVALSAASNAIGTIPDLAPLIGAAKAAGALTVVDAVHAAPHLALDRRGLGCDALLCSAYKFCGPHLGILAARRDLLDETTAYKVRPAPAAAPGKFETGTGSFEAMAGLVACLRYLGRIGADGGDPLARASLARAMQRVRAHERGLAQRFLAGVARIAGVAVHGLADPAREDRTPTFGLTFAKTTPQAACERLAERGVFAWAGHFYAIGLVEQLGLAQRGGLLRLGFGHYHDAGDVDRALAELRAIAA